MTSTMARQILAIGALLLTACGASAPKVSLPGEAPPRDAAALQAAADAFYAAKDPAAMQAAVDQARAAGAQAALYHELAAQLAWLEDRRPAVLEHLIAALLDPAADMPVLYLHRLAELDWTLDEQVQVIALLRALATEHPEPETRAYAGWMLSHALHYVDDGDGRDKALAALGPWLRPALIGPFDNDQGKGFDAEFPPERGIDLDAPVPGKLVPLSWRQDYTRDPRGKIDLGALFEPDTWQVGYGLAAVKVAEAGTYELRISSGDPLKVWVNDGLVFEGRRITRWLFDGLVIPVELRQGVNRVLIKSAQETGSWRLAARITADGGAALPAGRVARVEPDAAYTGDPAQAAPISDEAIIARHVGKLPDGPRKLFLQAVWANDIGLRAPAAALAEQFDKAHPGSVIGRYRLAMALWDNDERGRTADLLAALSAEAGETLLRIPLKQARFWRQQKQGSKARTVLVALAEKHPDRPGPARALADLHDKESWHEDRCALLGQINERWPRWPVVMFELADCYEDLRFYDQANALYRTVLAERPNDHRAMHDLHWRLRITERYGPAARLARRIAEHYPHLRSSWERLAETLRRKRDKAGAEAALKTLVELAPTDANAYHLMAKLALQGGETAHAVSLWKEAQARDPENQAIANRLAWLAPTEEEAWVAEAPTDPQIEAAIAGRGGLTVTPGADVIYLIDDEVTRLGADGSAQNIVTMVAHAVNQAGRDTLTRMKLRRGARTRVLHAYAVSPDGRRAEASSIRGRTVRFRQLEVGSTVVLQYRVDEKPDGYLAGHIARQWWFQSPRVQTAAGRWVLYMPPGTPVLQEVHGGVKFAQSTVEGLERLEWSIQGSPPVVLEPGMPTLQEAAAHVMVSTVPDWDMYWKWEQALLMDAFRESPDLLTLAEELLKGADTPLERVRRIHTYLIENIRYQQDYERTIAGVKPHAAPVVIARQYGDCKDKAVLFITLARIAGVEVHYALVRTRDAGPVRRDVPMQQFNHAIVYVPAQPGIPEERFYDPTVDALDVDVLREDDQGTWSLVYDPFGQTHAWREIPFQAPSYDLTRAELVAQVEPDGSIDGEMNLIAQGRVGSVLRKAARNPEQFAQLLSRQIVARAFPGGQLVAQEAVQVASIREPAKVRMAISAANAARIEGKELRMPLPFGWSPEGFFTLASRRHPLLMGAPRTLNWTAELDMPVGGKVRRAPETVEISSPCLVLKREVSVQAGKVMAEQTVEYRCERIPVADYAAHRAVAAQMLQALKQEIVVDIGRAKARPARPNGPTAQR